MPRQWYQSRQIVCENCDREYTWSGGAIAEMEGFVPDVCRFCYEHPDLHPIEIECDNASHPGFTFRWSPQEQQFYADRGLEEPALCKACREANKAQQPVRLKCSACERDYTYSRNYIISFKRNEGSFEGRDVCRLCFLDPQRAKGLKEKREEREKKKKEREEKLPFSDTLAYYLHSKGDGDGRFDSDIDLDTMTVQTTVESFDILSDPNDYRNISDPKHGDVWTHIMRSDHEWDKRLGTDDEETVFSEAAAIAESTDPDSIVQCKIRSSSRWAKFDITSAWVLIIRNNENPPPDYRLVTSYIATAEEVSRWIKSGTWILN